MRSLSRVPLLLLSLLLSAEAPAQKQAPVESPDRQFVIASDVPPEQSDLILHDLATLSAWKFAEGDTALQNILERPTLTGASVTQWLAERVHYILSEKLSLDAAVSPLPEAFSYENPGLLPLTAPNAQSAPQAQKFTQPIGGPLIMQNAGAMIYTHGKRTNTLFGLQIPGVGQVPLRSPRTGIIQIGAGMFLPLPEKYQKTDSLRDIRSTPYSIFRILTLLHEARHSDGNGLSLNFSHTFCPLGHDQEGTPACDNSTNGAYALEALVLRNMIASCTSCSVAEREVLKLELLAVQSRVLQEAPKYPLVARAYAICGRMQKNAAAANIALFPSLQQECDNVYQRLEMTPATKWDSRPEGRR